MDIWTTLGLSSFIMKCLGSCVLAYVSLYRLHLIPCLDIILGRPDDTHMEQHVPKLHSHSYWPLSLCHVSPLPS
jgi:hypothetical protein